MHQAKCPDSNSPWRHLESHALQEAASPILRRVVLKMRKDNLDEALTMLLEPPEGRMVLYDLTKKERHWVHSRVQQFGKGGSLAKETVRHKSDNSALPVEEIYKLDRATVITSWALNQLKVRTVRMWLYTMHIMHDVKRRSWCMRHLTCRGWQKALSGSSEGMCRFRFWSWAIVKSATELDLNLSW